MFRKITAFVIPIVFFLVFSAAFVIAAKNNEVPTIIRILIILWFVIELLTSIFILLDDDINDSLKGILLVITMMAEMATIFIFSFRYPNIEYPLLYIIQAAFLFLYIAIKIWKGKYTSIELNTDAF